MIGEITDKYIHDMIVGIHQPNYLPYFGFFDKIKKCDVFIIYDDAQFNKSDFQHRNRIRIYHGWKWLTVPVEKKHIPIDQIKINNDIKISGMDWSEAHFKEVHDNYKNASYYHEYKNAIQEIYEQPYDHLIDLNMKLIDFFIRSFDIDTEIVYSSEFGFSSISTEKIVNLVSEVGWDAYLSGSMGKNYLDFGQFDDHDIQVLFQEFEPPVYQQQYAGFIPNMSAMDILLNKGQKVDEHAKETN